jgi:hypothetical protein
VTTTWRKHLPGRWTEAEIEAAKRRGRERRARMAEQYGWDREWVPPSLRTGMYVDPAQLPTSLQRPATEPGQSASPCTLTDPGARRQR